MDDDNCLDLTLGMSLPCGGPSTSSKGKNGSSSDIRTEESDRGSKLIDDFKNFLDGGTQKPSPLIGSQKSEPSKPEENLFYDLSKSDASGNLNNGRTWVGNDNRSSEIEIERTLEISNKRKNIFSEKNHQKKQERDDQTRTSHISINTDEGSTAENEDVADSEADGPTSKLVQHHNDSSKKRSGSVGLSEGHKDVRGHGVSDSTAADSQGQIRFTISSEKDFKMGNVPYGVTYPGQSANILNMPYPLSGKDSNSNPIGGPVTSSYTLPGMIPVMTSANNDRTVTQPLIPANLPVTYGYPPVQVPTLNPGKSGLSGSHSLQFHPSYVGRGPPNSDKQNDGMKISQASRPVIGHQPSEQVKGDGKDGSSSHTENGAKESNTIGPTRIITNQPRSERFPSEYPAIRPGIAAELKFGGSGSSPNLPWVSTTGSGPHGRTISGVTYRFSATQIRIVCACHGSHLTPEEFVRHAVEEQPDPNPGSGLLAASAPNSNPAASAQS